MKESALCGSVFYFGFMIWAEDGFSAAQQNEKGSDSMSASTFPTYKGRPLVRCGDTLYYGNMTDKYVIKMDIKSKKKVKDLDVADKVTVQLMLTDSSIRNRKQIVKQSEKSGLYLALDIADAWLTRALAE